MKNLLLFFAAFIIYTSNYAQAIKYNDVNPDTTIDSWNSFTALGVEIWHHSGEVVIKTWGSTQVLCVNDTLTPKAVLYGESLEEASGEWKPQDYTCLNCGSFKGNWVGAKDKYLAVRNKNNSGMWVYGWIKLDVPTLATSFTIKDYATHTVGDTYILAGQIMATNVREDIGNKAPLSYNLDNKNVSFYGFNGIALLTIYDMSGRVLIKRTIQPAISYPVSPNISGLCLFQLQTVQLNQVFKIMML